MSEVNLYDFCNEDKTKEQQIVEEKIFNGDLPAVWMAITSSSYRFYIEFDFSESEIKKFEEDDCSYIFDKIYDYIMYSYVQEVISVHPLYTKKS